MTSRQSNIISIIYADGFPLSGGVKQGWGGQKKLFSSFMRQYLENSTRLSPKLLLMTNRKLHIGTKVDDLELL